jgi:hypothetical protein
MYRRSYRELQKRVPLLNLIKTYLRSVAPISPLVYEYDQVSGTKTLRNDVLVRALLLNKDGSK